MEVMWIEDPLDCVDKLLSLLRHHHFEFHLRVSHHVGYLVLVHRPHFIVFDEKILCRVVLAGCTTQSVGISFSRQVAELRLLGHLQMSHALNRRNALGG